MSSPILSPADRVLAALDHGLRALTTTPQAARPKPVATVPGDPLDDAERREAGAMMRVNHVGEICAQALYSAQALAATDQQLRRQFQQAADEETDHLAWTAERLRELGARPSLLNPLWYAGAFAIGLVAARAGDASSLGFLVETERQVERHLDGHLDRLPAADLSSRAIVAQMKDDEAGHAMAAERAGARPVPTPIRWAMRAAARVMTTAARYV
ncbi:MAG TPA: 2-polyprenyl-3-methyl-6-methoxy-1,4-benzoquinone monooxygenase [Caldimonas sp.]|nr:2-polyprenyl-3-methyl-6-methoxy-1,4-benzoquinone monooxygenase [Caldimonas sp.]HEX4233327.1 2-polyprenyl-3-methyl-6-methoxy-1,4-benzoquinone monooxygenase [Caldimonas sp.]